MNDCQKSLSKFLLKDPKNTQEIQPFQSQLTKCRIKSIAFISNKINEVRKSLESLKSEIYSLPRTEKVDDLRKKMFDISEKIRHLKYDIKETLITLSTTEKTLIKELQVFVKKMEDWAKPFDLRPLKPVKQNSCRLRLTTEQNPVVRFRNFVASSAGHCGGWQLQDHLTFLRERSKHKDKQKFISTLQAFIPELSSQVIEEHEKWYAKYLELKNSQKEAITKWKLEKEISWQKKEQTKEELENRNKNKKQAQHKMDLAERIKQWKSQQLRKKLEMEENMRKEKEKLREEQERKRQLQQMKKQAVAIYKAEKLNKLQTETAPRPNANRGGKNKLLLKAFMVQNLKLIEKKKMIRVQIESKSHEKPDRIKLTKPAIEFILERNPKRVFQPTFNWNQHCLATQTREKLTPAFHLSAIQKLAIPEWRKEVK